MSEDKNYYYDDFTDRAADAGIYDDFEGAATGSRRSTDGGKNNRKKKRRKERASGAGRAARKGKKPVDPKKRRRKTALIIVICLALLVLCGYVLAKQFVKEKFEQADRVEVNTEDWGIDPRVQEELKDYKNIVLLGVDTREGLGETDESGVRSDAIIIVTINKKTNEITLTSVLRDSYLDLEEKGTHVIDKVTHAHAYGGPVNTVRALNRNLDLNIDDFVRVDWRSVAEITDAMGGLEVTIDDSEIDEMNKILAHTNSNLGTSSPLIESTGPQTLDGPQIVTYCRIRKSDGDDYRADRMREVIKAAVDKAKTMKLSELNNLINMGMKKITTSMSSDTMMDMVMNLSNFGKMGSKRWPFNYDGALLNGIWYDAPITLKSNVVQLHEELFGQVDYQPTDNVLMINEEVKMETQFYGDEEADYDLLQRYLDTFGGGPNAGTDRHNANLSDDGSSGYDPHYDNSDYSDDSGDSGSDYTDDSSQYDEPSQSNSSSGGGSESSGNSGGESNDGGSDDDVVEVPDQPEDIPVDDGSDDTGGDGGE